MKLEEECVSGCSMDTDRLGLGLGRVVGVGMGHGYS